jgi:hypothetical protein
MQFAQRQPIEANHEIEDAYGLTPLQQGMLFYTLQAPEAGAYLNRQSYCLEGEPDVEAFQEAFRQLIQRHTMLRTGFVLQPDGEPRQVAFNRHTDLPFQYHGTPIGRRRKECLLRCSSPDARKDLSRRVLP